MEKTTTAPVGAVWIALIQVVSGDIRDDGHDLDDGHDGLGGRDDHSNVDWDRHDGRDVLGNDKASSPPLAGDDVSDNDDQNGPKRRSLKGSEKWAQPNWQNEPT